MKGIDPAGRLPRLAEAGIDPWPPRSRRTLTLAQLGEVVAAAGPSCGLPVLGDGPQPSPVVAGRLVSLLGTTLTLADATAQRALVLSAPCPLADCLAPGDQVEVEIDPTSGLGGAVRLLAPALTAAPAPQGALRPFDGAAPGGGATLATLRRRSLLLHALRTWFVGQGFVEVETPAMAPIPGMEPHLDPFETRFRPYPGAPGRSLFLLTSPEYAMKRLVAAGMDRCFQLSRVFRNGEVGPMHNPEFTMLEWYRAHASYREIEEDTRDLILHLARAAGLGLGLEWAGHRVDLTPPWERLTVAEAVRRYAAIELGSADDADALLQAARGAGIDVPEGSPWDETFFRILLERVEPRLGFQRPTFLVDYPPPLAALSRVRGGASPVAERFELYIAGVEIANAFTELNDPVQQAARFEEERAQRAALGAPDFEPDPAYLAALASGLPPTGGIALGVDRLMMILLGAPDLRRALAFPFEG